MTSVPAVGSVVGTTTRSHWAQTIKTPYAYGVLETKDESGFAQEVGMQIVSRVEEMFSCEVTRPEEVDTIFKNMTTQGVASLVLVVPVDKLLYVAVYGKGVVWVKRKGKYAKLIDGEVVTSGVFLAGDVILLVTDACSGLMSEEEFLGIFDHLTPAESADQLAMHLHEKENLEGCAAIILEMKNTPFSLPQDKLPAVKRTIGRIPQFFKTPGAGITILLLTIFFFSIIVGIKREFGARRDEKMNAVVGEASRVFEEGQALMDLNPVKGRERLAEAKKMLAPVVDIVTMKTKEGRKILALSEEISRALVAALHAYTVEPELSYDAGLLKSGGAISTIGPSDSVLVMADTAQKAVYTLTLPAKTGQIIAGGDGFEKVLAVGVHGNTVFVVYPDGVHAISVEDRKMKQNVIKKNDDWGMIRAAVTFGGNIYLLDTQKSRIWKYIGQESGFSEMREYLNPDTLPDLSGATGMAIDGSVWLGTTNGKILRFTQGKENAFTARGVEPALGMNLVVATSDSEKNLYILDKNNKLVVVLDKDGIYLAQYSWEKQIMARELAVSEKQGKIFLLAGGKLYSIDLK